MTEEIVRLINTDRGQSKRIEAFEKHIKATTELAVEAIKKAAIRDSKSLKKQVTIPVTVIAAVATLIQWIIQKIYGGL